MRRWWGRVLGGVGAVVVASAVVASALVGPATRPAGAGGHRAAADGGLHPVGMVVRTFVDRSRKTPADPSAGITPSSRRVLPTTIYYPARGTTAVGTVTPDAIPARGGRPLVLFNPGSPGSPSDYEVLLADWAAHGYVVAAIEFPVSSVAGPDDVAQEDLPAQTKDARFVLDRVLGLDSEKVGIPEIDRDRLAVAGHSFGGATALSLASKCCRDDRFDAVVALAAVSRTEAGPALKRPVGPILFVHGRNDRAVSYARAVDLCERTGRPKRFLTVEEIRGPRAHVTPYVGQGDEYSAVVRPAVVDFLDGYVRGEKAARARLDRAGEGTPVGAVTRCRPGETTTTTASR